jgi:hypothetical protein
MEVVEAGKYDDVCSYDTKNTPPAWCKYENSNPEGDSAFVANFDDYYYDDGIETVDSETIHVSGAAGKTFEFYVSHWFFGKDYYADLPTWNDFMMAATLRIRNMSHETQKQLGSGGWSHPTDISTPTHIRNESGKYVRNPEYQGDFKVDVSCDDQCFCTAVYEVL